MSRVLEVYYYGKSEIQPWNPSTVSYKDKALVLQRYTKAETNQQRPLFNQLASSRPSTIKVNDIPSALGSRDRVINIYFIFRKNTHATVATLTTHACVLLRDLKQSHGRRIGLLRHVNRRESDRRDVLAIMNASVISRH